MGNNRDYRPPDGSLHRSQQQASRLGSASFSTSSSSSSSSLFLLILYLPPILPLSSPLPPCLLIVHIRCRQLSCSQLKRFVPATPNSIRAGPRLQRISETLTPTKPPLVHTVIILLFDTPCSDPLNPPLGDDKGPPIQSLLSVAT
ncbi:uncharacterized protein LY89DRAFT_338859 [Mollisia scopiformis]|uniref:Uncharacterized protein n=1 Tax=Mollisia scopiformis TaxID=149040 RepID=A0A132B8D1_MOLSC|nr:uncharacterized protein LY89DRAFT_338859 [Mollisia scopiformis]KUJ08249.1 hypothetical protein LY89DRAFT_338859 [Mollisia scopiformis]